MSTPGSDSSESALTLSDLQVDVLRALWAAEERSVADIAEALRPARSLAHTTVSTLLTRLEKRGAVTSRREGRQLMYRANVAEAEVRRSMVSGLLRSLFASEGRALVAHLVREDQLSGEDLAELRGLIDRTERRDD